MGLSRIDIFPKFNSAVGGDARERTLVGAICSLVMVAVLTALFVGETNYYFSVEVHRELLVDATLSPEMVITSTIDFHSVSCAALELDVIDVLGDTIINNTLHKQKLGEIPEKNSKEPEKGSGTNDLPQARNATSAANATKKCGSCHGAADRQTPCCNTCKEVEIAYSRRGWSFDPNDPSIVQCVEERKQMQAPRESHTARVNMEGCRLEATAKVRKTKGEMRFLPRCTGIANCDISNLNLSHTIRHFGFGEPYPGLKNPLNGHFAQPSGEMGTGIFMYFLKVVPTTYVKKSGFVFHSNQYSANKHYTNHQNEMYIPGVFFSYDISPIAEHLSEEGPYPSVVHFVLQLCAIGGGVFTVLSLIDALFYHGIGSIKRKLLLGKQT